MGTSEDGSPAGGYPLWRGNDWNGFWALLAQNLAGLVFITGVLTRVAHLPERTIDTRVLPGLGLGLAVGMAFFSMQAVRLGRRERRTDTTALPYAISLPAVVLFLVGVLGPIYHDALEKGADFDQAAQAAWRGGLAAAALAGLIECLGSAFGPWLRRRFPRPAMLGSLAGLAIAFIATVPLSAIFEHPYVGFPAMAVMLAGLVAGLRLPFGLPAGLVAVGLGVLVGCWTGLVVVPAQAIRYTTFPVPVLGDWLRGWSLLLGSPGACLVACAVGVQHFFLTLINVDSAEAEGDAYPVRATQFLSGLSCIVGSLCGSCFPTTVAPGHPAYKRLGSGTGYSLAVAPVVLFLTATGLTGLVHQLIPSAAVSPLLVFVGLTLTAQAFSCVPSKQALAVAVALIPHLSNLVVTGVQGVLSSSDLKMDDVLVRTLLSEQGVHWEGLSALAGGAVVTGLLWGAITSSVLDNQMHRASRFSLLACVLTALGVMHASRLTYYFGPITAGYLILAIAFHMAGVLHWQPAAAPSRGRILEVVPNGDGSGETGDGSREMGDGGVETGDTRPE